MPFLWLEKFNYFSCFLSIRVATSSPFSRFFKHRCDWTRNSCGPSEWMASTFIHPDLVVKGFLNSGRGVVVQKPLSNFSTVFRRGDLFVSCSPLAAQIDGDGRDLVCSGCCKNDNVKTLKRCAQCKVGSLVIVFRKWLLLIRLCSFALPSVNAKLGLHSIKSNARFYSETRFYNLFREIPRSFAQRGLFACCLRF